MLTIDFETYYDKDYSLSKMTTEQYIRDPRFQVIGVSVKENDGPIKWITGELPVIKAELAKYNWKQSVVAHNMAFDGAILSWVFDIHPPTLVDTLSMARPYTGLTVGGSLRALAKEFKLGEKGTEIYNTLGKRREDFTPEELERFGEYCRTDVELTYKLVIELFGKVPTEELRIIDLHLKMFTEPKVVLDKPRLEAHLEEVRRKKAELMSKVTVDRTNLMSNPKFAQILKDHGVEPPMKMSPTTGKETYAFAKTDIAFKELLNHPNEEVQALVAARLGCKSTLEETRTEALIHVAERGPLPILLNYYGASTGRSSGGQGLNLQNLPRKGALRHSLMAPPGHKFVACDSSNVEARVLGWFCGQPDLLEQYKHGVDVYCEFGGKIYGHPINKDDHPTERHVAKTCILGLGYGVGAKKLDQSLKTSFIPVDLGEEECRRLVTLYRGSYPEIPAMWRKCDGVLKSMMAGGSGWIGEGCSLYYEPEKIWLPNGMYIYYPELGYSDEGELEYTRKRLKSKIYGGKVVENLIQALARIVVFQQAMKINHFLSVMGGNKNNKVRQIVLMVHDEVVCVVPEAEAEKTQEMMLEFMCEPPAWAQGLPVSAEAGIADNYGDAK